MHILIGIAVLACLVAFVFGEHMARVFIGTLLCVGAAIILFIVYIAVVDINRQSNAQPHTVVRMGTPI